MMRAEERAEQASMQSFLNCYLRETQEFERIDTEDHPFREEGQTVLRLPLGRQDIHLYVNVDYWSLTGRHLFRFPAYYKTGRSGDYHTLDYVTMTTLIVKEWLIGNGREWSEDELVLRVLLSCKKVKGYIKKREGDQEQLSDEFFTFIEAEQSLLFGHLLHPTPKSKQGLTDLQDDLYTPELKGRFQLHYFSADPSIVAQDSSLSKPAVEWIKEEAVKGDRSDRMTKEWEKGRYLLPLHPLQAEKVLQEPEVQELLTKGLLTDLGPAGAPFTASSSFRTLYNETSRFMYKFSVPVKITNSLRINQPKELARGVEVSRLLDTELGREMKENHPDFQIIKDPASVNVRTNREVSGFEVVLRENPFYNDETQVTAVAALVQDHAYGKKARLASIVHNLAEKEKRSTEDVSLDWFDRYLSISLDPILWLLSNYGIALEAHQQNSVVRLKEGYPETFYYRDNQGYYFSRSSAEKLSALLPSVNEESDTICDDVVAEERLRYYFFFNHLFGIINGFGVNGLVEEEKLLDLLRTRLADWLPMNVVHTLLEEEKLPCKANLLTRLYDMDELVGPMESQSVYTNVYNPLAAKVGAHHEV
ncbi:IucA/IucC family siderophore biosynthesis protein [Halobacillus kuroshimensis]|uniref:IucA/IucC family siderophore biosynthesis protein n=2 Tax=Halobacillus kuroshimensis TaxID=302481 RepID=A0ABS3DR51_9BACI|nr:IucA/IucC family protein [Halobacillus kuroshimensis]MBN8233784.1 IucA/IucC family siderophore biosynthesis protein [Halobacillus kuroshimensis]